MIKKPAAVVCVDCVKRDDESLAAYQHRMAQRKAEVARTRREISQHVYAGMAFANGGMSKSGRSALVEQDGF